VALSFEFLGSRLEGGKVCINDLYHLDKRLICNVERTHLAKVGRAVPVRLAEASKRELLPLRCVRIWIDFVLSFVCRRMTKCFDVWKVIVQALSSAAGDG
jgi:hypothetical protein